MKFTFTPFDKAILAAALGPLIVWVTTYLNGGDFDTKNLAAAVVAAIVAGLGVYLKGNAPASAPAPSAPVVVPPAAP